MISSKPTLFISYCQRDGGYYADELEAQLRDHFEVIRDKSKLKAYDDLDEFMAQVAMCDYVIIVLTETYAKSLNCMVEMATLVQQEDWDLTTTILVIDQSFYDFSRQLEILSYWDSARRLCNKNGGLGSNLMAARKQKIGSICQALEPFFVSVSGRMNPSQIAIVSEIIRKSKSNNLKEEKNNIIQSGEKATLKILEENSSLSAKELAEKTGRSLSSTKRYLSSLIEQGQVETIGNKGRLKYYKVNRNSTGSSLSKLKNE